MANPFQSPQVKEFLTEYEALCRRHGMHLDLQEDVDGAATVYDLEENDLECLSEAIDKTKGGEELEAERLRELEDSRIEAWNDTAVELYEQDRNWHGQGP